MSEDFDEEYYLSQNPDVVLALKRGLVQTGWEHYVRFGKDEGRLPVPPAGASRAGASSAHRERTLELLVGSGIEIGALDRPCPVAEGVEVRYVDRFDAAGAVKLLSGIAVERLVDVSDVVHVDREGLSLFETESLDFCIACNVIQHLANPIRFLEEIFRVTRPGGHVVISAPDKRFTFESVRPVTGFEHLLDEYFQEVSEVSDAHYVDLLVLFCPSDVEGGIASIAPRLDAFRKKLEHAHVWDTAGFRELLTRGLRVVDVDASIAFEATGDDTRFEHFVVFRKNKQLYG